MKATMIFGLTSLILYRVNVCQQFCIVLYTSYFTHYVFHFVQRYTVCMHEEKQLVLIKYEYSLPF